jgi:predicted alpha-1,2-mannosidase
VFQDFNGLAKLMGGEKVMENMLDSVFVLPPIFDTSSYKRTIHEMVEMQVMNMGQYAHGNQPIQHMLYIYNYCGAPWKSQLQVRDALDKLYKPTPDGYCGDEDNGQTSAWYVFSAMGFYSVCPGSNEYVFGSPLFKKITIDLGKGNKFTIESPNNAPANVYIGSALLNGTPYNKNYINHFDIRKGGVLKFNMSSLPNKKRGVSPEAYPFSISKTSLK